MAGSAPPRRQIPRFARNDRMRGGVVSVIPRSAATRNLVWAGGAYSLDPRFLASLGMTVSSGRPTIRSRPPDGRSAA